LSDFYLLNIILRKKNKITQDWSSWLLVGHGIEPSLPVSFPGNAGLNDLTKLGSEVWYLWWLPLKVLGAKRNFMVLV
jgi:hypothetical protein